MPLDGAPGYATMGMDWSKFQDELNKSSKIKIWKKVIAYDRLMKIRNCGMTNKHCRVSSPCVVIKIYKKGSKQLFSPQTLANQRLNTKFKNRQKISRLDYILFEEYFRAWNIVNVVKKLK